MPPTHRLRLEPLRVEDADEMVDVLSDARLYEFTGGSPPHVEELRRRYEVQVAGVSPDGREAWLNWVVRLRSDGTAIGYVQASIERAGADAEVAWVIGRAWQGQGYASEAVGSMVTALRAAGTRRLVAHVQGGPPGIPAGGRTRGSGADGQPWSTARSEWAWRRALTPTRRTRADPVPSQRSQPGVGDTVESIVRRGDSHPKAAASRPTETTATSAGRSPTAPARALATSAPPVHPTPNDSIRPAVLTRPSSGSGVTCWRYVIELRMTPWYETPQTTITATATCQDDVVTTTTPDTPATGSHSSASRLGETTAAAAA